MAQGKLDKAVHAYHRVLALEPDHFAAHCNLAYCLVKQERRKEALQHYKIAHDLKPDDVTARYLMHALLGDERPATAPKEYVQNLFDNYALHYDRQMEKTLCYNVPQQLKKYLEPYLPEKTSVSLLDLGCGTGMVGDLLQSWVHRVVGVDLSQKMIDQARAKGVYHELIQSDIASFLAECESLFNGLSPRMFWCTLATAKYFSFGRSGGLPRGPFCFYHRIDRPTSLSASGNRTLCTQPPVRSRTRRKDGF